MKWTLLHLPWVLALVIFYVCSRITASFWFYARTRRAIIAKFPYSNTDRVERFRYQWQNSNDKTYLLQFWRTGKSFIKNWGFMEMSLTGPSGSATTPAKLAAALKNQPGWNDLIVQLCERLLAYPEFDGHVGRIGVKYGTLVFQIHPRAPEILRQIVYAAVEQASRTCDQCGQRGWTLAGKELKVRCSEHEEKP